MAIHHIQRPITYVVKTETTLLSFLTDEHNGISRNKAKAILKGGGVKVNGKISTTPLLKYAATNPQSNLTTNSSKLSMKTPS